MGISKNQAIGTGVGAIFGPVGAAAGFGLGSMFGEKEEESVPTLADMINQWGSTAQTVFDYQKKLAPQEAQLNLDLLSQYGLPMAQTQQNIFSQLYPQLSQLPETLSAKALEGMQSGLTSNEQRILTDAIRANLGEQAVSGLGTQRLGADLINATNQRQQYYTNLGQNLSGRVPIYQGTVPQYSNFLSSYTPTSTFGTQLESYNMLPTSGIEQLLAVLGQIGGTAAGAYFGGPAGAQIGGQVGSQFGTMMA